MRLQDIVVLYYKFNNVMITLKKIREYKNNSIYGKLIKENSKYKNKHLGERCFIVANGPSLKEQDLTLLKDEYVFTLNGMPFYEKYSILKSNFHIMMDPRYFDMRHHKHPVLRTLEIISKINSNQNKPICFFPLSAFDYLKRYKIDKRLNINYIDTSLFLWDGYSKSMEFDKPVPGAQSVSHCAIELAVYMGFKQIYLLGCDGTGIVQDISSEYGNFSNSHIYNQSERLTREKLKHVYTMEEVFDGHAKIMHDYRTIYNYCYNKGVKLVNCSSKTIIQSIPRANYLDIIQK